MKARSYYVTHSYNSSTEPFSETRIRPWEDQSSHPVLVTQYYYMWSTSVPRSWRVISPRPFRRIKGEKRFKRGTLDFLKETQKYINTITKPTVDQSIIENATVLGTSPQPATEDAKQEEKRAIKPLSALQSPHNSFFKDFSSPRGASLPRLLSLAGLGKERSCIVKIHNLVPFSSQKPRRSRNTDKFLQTDVMQYVHRFDQQPEKRSFRLTGSHLHRRVTSEIAKSVLE